jgi:hypothetical protein
MVLMPQPQITNPPEVARNADAKIIVNAGKECK